MPHRIIVANELGEFLSVIAHPRRIQIIEELRNNEKDVGTLQKALDITHSNVSQHLAALRSQRVVTEHREGRRVFYRLCLPQLADWLVQGVDFLPAISPEHQQLKTALNRAKKDWSPSGSPNRIARKKKE